MKAALTTVLRRRLTRISAGELDQEIFLGKEQAYF